MFFNALCLNNVILSVGVLKSLEIRRKRERSHHDAESESTPTEFRKKQKYDCFIMFYFEKFTSVGNSKTLDVVFLCVSIST